MHFWHQQLDAQELHQILPLNGARMPCRPNICSGHHLMRRSIPHHCQFAPAFLCCLVLDACTSAWTRSWNRATLHAVRLLFAPPDRCSTWITPIKVITGALRPFVKRNSCAGEVTNCRARYRWPSRRAVGARVNEQPFVQHRMWKGCSPLLSRSLPLSNGDTTQFKRGRMP